MPFAADTSIKIMMILELPITVSAYVERVNQALQDAQLHVGEAAVALIEGYVAQYQAAQTKLSSESANAALIRADVLEWAAGQRNVGYQQEMSRLRGLIAKTLMLDSLSPSKSGRVQIRRG